MDGAGSGGAHDSRSSGAGSADWTASFADGSTSLDIEKMRLVNKIEHIKEKLVAANKTKEGKYTWLFLRGWSLNGFLFGFS